jgi:hypothetical protein
MDKWRGFQMERIDAVRMIWNFINYLLKIYGAVVKGDAAPSLTFLIHKLQIVVNNPHQTLIPLIGCRQA